MMQMFGRMDNWTLLACIALTTSASAFAFGRTWQTQRTSRGAGAFALAFLSGTLSCVLFTVLPVSSALPRFGNIVVGDTLTLCVYALLLTGVEQFFGVMWSTKFCWVFVAVSSVLLWYFTFPSSSLRARTFLMSCGAAVLCALMGVEFLRHPGRRHLRTTSALMFLFVGEEIVSAYRTTFRDGPKDWYGWMHSKGPQQLSLLTTMAFMISVGQLLFLLINGELVMQLADEATRDYMTNALNRRGIEKALTLEMERSQRYKTELAIALVDIDRFKEINDTRGHAEGDQILTTVAHTFAQSLRACDLIGRFGGDEFLVILPNTPTSEAAGAMERIRETIAGTSAEAITLSIGITSAVEKDTMLTLLARVDEALYEAKNNGRDRTRVR